jgi:hypothetical protein
MDTRKATFPLVCPQNLSVALPAIKRDCCPCSQENPENCIGVPIALFLSFQCSKLLQKDGN